jgi:hypothetical protein
MSLYKRFNRKIFISKLKWEKNLSVIKNTAIVSKLAITYDLYSIVIFMRKNLIINENHHFLN